MWHCSVWSDCLLFFFFNLADFISRLSLGVMQSGGVVGVGPHSALYLEATLAQQVPSNTTVHVWVSTWPCSNVQPICLQPIHLNVMNAICHFSNSGIIAITTAFKCRQLIHVFNYYIIQIYYIDISYRYIISE